MKKLFSPIEVGSLKLKNRVVMTAMDLSYTVEGHVTDRVTAFYEERARGGAGLIIVGGCKIDEYSGAKQMMDISDDRFLPGLQRLTKSLHRYDSCVAAQLFHAGKYAHSSEIGRQPIAPSAIASKFTREEPREMTGDDIKRTVENFAEAAARAKRAGFEAVEILGNAGYLISEFLSPVTNKRTDEYGGSLEARMKFGLEVTDAIRRVVGKGFTVLIRLAGNDFMPGGNTNTEARAFAVELEKHGVDAFNITGGWHETRVPQVPMELPRGGFAYLAKGVKSVVSKPVIACNRINDPLLADKVIRQGNADMVGFARALLADPEMPNKAREGRLDEITLCIGCNQGCLDNSLRHRPVECMVNPRVGREHEVANKVQATHPKKVMVVGGGPAGLFAAKTAALAGHRVTLYEKNENLGGQLFLAGAVEGRREFRPFVERLARQVETAGVSIHKNKKVEEAVVKGEKPDVVILATGGEPVKLGIPGADRGTVVHAWDVLADKVDVGREVVVIGAGATGVDTALHIAQMGTLDALTLQFLFDNKAEEEETLWELSNKGTKKVTVIEMQDKVGSGIGLSTRGMKLGMLSRYGVQVKTKVIAKEITLEGVVVVEDGKTNVMKCDSVVIAAGVRPAEVLHEKVKEQASKVVVIGDAKKPQNGYQAIRDGFMAAREI